MLDYHIRVWPLKSLERMPRNKNTEPTDNPGSMVQCLIILVKPVAVQKGNVDIKLTCLQPESGRFTCEVKWILA